MGEDSANTGHTEARAMLDAFASVGATSFDVTWTTAEGLPRRYSEGVILDNLRAAMPRMLDEAAARTRNLIVRPEGGPGVHFIQLDDLTAARHQIVTGPLGGLAYGSLALSHLPEAAFLILETSPGSFQAWLALPGGEDKDFTRRVKKATGADATASGATRVAGSLNYKAKYDPKKTGKPWPRVAIRVARHGQTTTADKLKEFGLVAPPQELPPLRVTPARSIPGSNRTWPSYAKALDGAPPNSEGTGPDTSRADIVWCMTAITWGFDVEKTAERLSEEPDSKAYRRTDDYAITTARKAALYVQQRKGQSQPRGRIATHGRG
jgi:RepB DNA-primase from phage plasmid